MAKVQALEKDIRKLMERGAGAEEIGGFVIDRIHRTTRKKVRKNRNTITEEEIEERAQNVEKHSRMSTAEMIAQILDLAPLGESRF
jgi:hypothetical protein